MITFWEIGGTGQCLTFGLNGRTRSCKNEVLGGWKTQGWLAVGFSGDVPRGERMLYPGTDPEQYIHEYTLKYEDQLPRFGEMITFWRIAGTGQWPGSA